MFCIYVHLEYVSAFVSLWLENRAGDLGGGGEALNCCLRWSFGHLISLPSISRRSGGEHDGVFAHHAGSSRRVFAETGGGSLGKARGWSSVGSSEVHPRGVRPSPYCSTSCLFCFLALFRTNARHNSQSAKGGVGRAFIVVRPPDRLD